MTILKKLKAIILILTALAIIQPDNNLVYCNEDSEHSVFNVIKDDESVEELENHDDNEYIEVKGGGQKIEQVTSAHPISGEANNHEHEDRSDNGDSKAITTTQKQKTNWFIGSFHQTAELSILDIKTGEKNLLTLRVDNPTIFKKMTLLVTKCWQEDHSLLFYPESRCYIKVFINQNGDSSSIISQWISKNHFGVLLPDTRDYYISLSKCR